MVISCIHVREWMNKVIGKESEDTTNSMLFAKNWSRDGQEFLFQDFQPKRLLVIRISSSSMRGDSILSDS